MTYAQYYMYPTASSNTATTTSTRQYSPNAQPASYYQTNHHQAQHHPHHQNYMNPVNNYYFQYQNQYRYRWPVNYGYGYAQPSPYPPNYNEFSNSYYVNHPIVKIIDTAPTKSTERSIKKKKSKRSEKKVEPSLSRKSAHSPLLKAVSKTPLSTQTHPDRPKSVTLKNMKRADEQKVKDNIRMQQLIMQLTNQTQIELNKLIEMRNRKAAQTRQITYLGIVTANPSDYVKKYGKDLIEPVNPKEQAYKEKPPNVIETAAAASVTTAQSSKQSRPESEEQLKQLVDSEDLETITVEPSLSSKNVSPSDEDIQVTLYASHSTNERTYKLAVDENGQYSLKAI